MFSIYLSIFLLASYYYLKRRIADYFSFDARIKAFQTEQFQDTPETLDPVWRPVKGTLPPYLNGILYRIGKYFTTVSSSITWQFPGYVS